MFLEILRQSWDALRRQPFRSFLTMLGIVWGIVAVSVLIAYGNSFRDILVTAFNALVGALSFAGRGKPVSRLAANEPANAFTLKRKIWK